jgi:hypothetical protein
LKLKVATLVGMTVAPGASDVANEGVAAPAIRSAAIEIPLRIFI